MREKIIDWFMTYVTYLTGLVCVLFVVFLSVFIVVLPYHVAMEYLK